MSLMHLYMHEMWLILLTKPLNVLPLCEITSNFIAQRGHRHPDPFCHRFGIFDANVRFRRVCVLHSAVALRPPSTPTACLNHFRIRADRVQGNQIHSGTLWTLGFPKMYMATLGYKGKVSLLKL